MLLMISMEKKLFEHFMKKKLQKANQQEFRIEKVIKQKGDKLYVERNDCDCSFNRWIDKKYLIQQV